MLSFVRRVAVALLAAAPFAGAQAQAAALPTAKVAYVDSRYILNNAPGTPAASALLNKEGQAMQAQAQRWSDSLDAMQAAFTKEQEKLSGDKRDARIKAINEKQAEYQQRYQALQQQAQDREAEVMQPILDQIKLALEDVRNEMGLTMILDISNNGILVAADKNLNVSDRVVAKLRLMPVPAVTEKKADAKGDAKGPATKAPSGGPVQGPAGVGSKAAAGAKAPAKADSAGPKKPDSAGVKKPDQH
jgi:outer membrane protein